MKLKGFLFFIFFGISAVALSQKITLSGAVKDSLQNPLSYANVLAKPKNVNKNIQFAITDNEGYYKLLLDQGDTITISISYLGYKPINYQFVASQNTQKNFVLQPSSEQLDEIVIEMPVTVRGDTTTYKTSKFVDGSERKLKNVLKKLPGVEVDKGGGVTVQGKKVTTMLVDGKKFFGGGSKLAVENIPADAVGDVEVIDNYNEVSFLKGISDSDDMAMNIKLKKDKKRFVFGDVEAGKGNKSFYKTSANLFYYAPKINLNFIGNSNNTGEKTFTFKDYLSFSGGVNAVFNGNFNFKGGDFSQFMESNDLQTSEQNFGALNITKTASSKLDVAAYGIFSNNKTTSLIEDLNEYTTFTEQRSNETATDNLLGIANLNLEYNANSQERWVFRTQLKRTNNENNNSLRSIINSQTNRIVTNRNLKANYANQNIEWHKRLNAKHTFSGIVNFLYDENNNDAFWQTQDPILQGLIPTDNTQNLLQIQQTKQNTTRNFDAVFKHFWEVNNSNHIYTTLGNKWQQQSFFTDDSQLLNNGTSNNFATDGFGNDVDFQLNDFFLGLHYKFRTGIFTVKQGFEAHKYTWSILQQNQIHRDKWVVLPDFLATIEFNKSKKIQLNYNLKTSFSEASNFANRFYLRSYNSVFKGNENLENNLFHAARISYNRFSLYRGIMLFANINYNKQIRGVRSTVDFQNINQFLTLRMFENPNENLSATAHLDKTINKIKYQMEVGFNHSNFLQVINNTLQTNKNNSYNYQLGFTTLFDKFPTIELGVKTDIGNFTASNNTSKFVTTQPFINIDYAFSKGFIFNFEYLKSNYQNKNLGQKNSYEIANTTFSYRGENSGWLFKISAQNLFNAQFKQSNSFSNYIISDTKTFILPRIVMFSIGYNL